MDYLLIMLLGASLGSFAGLVLERFPNSSIVSPRSHCDACGRTLGVRDLIPILSCLCQDWTCRFCGARIPFYYSLLELTFSLILLFGWLGILGISQVLCLCFGLLLSLYDLREQSYPLILILLAGGILLFFQPWKVSFFALLLLGVLAQLLPMGIGSGDFYYLALVSLSLDLRSLLWVIQLGSLLAIGACLKKKDHQALAFLPFLSLAYLVEIILEQLTKH